MPETLLLFLVFIISLLSNILGGVLSGGASLFGISLLLLLGIPAPLAMSTYTIGSIPARLSAVWGYWNSGKIVWKYTLLLSVLGFSGSIIGATFLVEVQREIVSILVNLILIGFIPLIFLKFNLGTQHTTVSRQRLILGHVFYFMLAIWTSFFAAWTGIVCLYLYLYFFGFTILETKATDSVAGTAIAIGALLVFISHGVFDIRYLLVYIPGAIVGGYIGAKLALRLGNARLKVLVWLSISAISAKVIFQAKTSQYLQYVLLLFR